MIFDCDDGFGDQIGQHVWVVAQVAAIERDGLRCLRCSSTGPLEVNHIVPLDGSGYGPSCAHHASNLETLCHDCHALVSKAQRWGWIQSATLIPDHEAPLCLVLGFYSEGPEVVRYLKSLGWRRVTDRFWQSPDPTDAARWATSEVVGRFIRELAALRPERV